MITFEYVSAGYSRKANELLALLNDPSVQTQINFKIGNAVNQFVPMKSGALRHSMWADSNGVHWSTPYAHYQYEGVVYGPNIPGLINGVGGFRSPSKKYPTGRKLGGELYWDMVSPAFVKTGARVRKANANDPDFPWVFGYSTPGTTDHWMKMYSGSQWKGGAGEGGIKAKTNLDITKFLKAECRKRGLNR